MCVWALHVFVSWTLDRSHQRSRTPLSVRSDLLFPCCARSDAKAATHTYATAGDYEVALAGEMGHFGFGGGDIGDRSKLVNIRQWGCVQLGQVGGQFEDCRNLGVVSARDVPDLRAGTNMSYMFFRASSFQSDLSGWNVSAVTNMGRMFHGASSFQDAERPRFQ